jgi:hypothetical protein
MKTSEVKAPHPGGRPTTLTPQMMKQAESLAGYGFTMARMGEFWGVTEETVIEWAKKNKEFSESLKKGRQAAIVGITSSLYDKARAGDVTAMIFFLKNRAPDLWKDRREERIEHTIGAPTWTEEKTYIRTPEEEQVIIEAGKALELRKKKKEDSK